jgi:Mg-chelatase subunit ChlD
METAFGQLALARPAWLAAMVLLPLAAYCSRRDLTGFSRARHAAALSFRMLLIAAVVLALCGIRVTRETNEKYVVLAVDQSESVSEASRRKAEAFVQEVEAAIGGHRSAVLPLARPPAVDHGAEHTIGEPDPEGTDLAAAIHLAVATLPYDWVPHVVLLTDGVETEGDALAAARGSPVPISTVPLESRADPEVYVSAVRARGQAQQGEPFSVDAVIHSSRDGECALNLFRDGDLVAEKRVKLAVGESRARFVQTAAGERPITLTARIDGCADTLSQNNSASAVVFTTPRPRVLLVESEPRLARHLGSALSGEGIDVATRRPDGIPKSLADLRQFELVILSNVPARLISQDQMELMRTYVGELGGGLIVVGGDQALTPGGYHQTTLEEILPVWCEFEKREERPSLAMALVIDCSGSMEEGGAIELAKQATCRAVELLQPRDQVGVIAFQDWPEWISPLRPCSDKKLVLDRIETITAGGGTNMYPAIERAYLALRESEAELKHVILLTDGVSHPGDFDRLVTEMAAAGITVSTVAVGPEAVRPLLDHVAQIGNGHHYYCDTAEDVPEIFALETASAGKMGIIEQPFRAQVERSLDALVGVDVAAAPSLLGYVETRPKPTSQVILTSGQGHPVLIWWRYGLGVSVAFTSDVESRWAAAWLRWPGFGRFWAQLVRHAMRKDQAEDFTLRIDQGDRLATVTLDAVDPQGRYLNGAEGVLEVIAPDRSRRQRAVDQVAPGRYAADFDTPEAGTYYLELRLSHGGQLVYVERRGLVAGYADEYRTRPTDHELLRAIAETTGGSYDPEPAAVVAPSERTVPRTTLLWPFFLASAAVVLVLDLAVRRMPRLGGTGVSPVPERLGRQRPGGTGGLPARESARADKLPVAPRDKH